MKQSKQVLSGFIWRFLERSGAQFVTFIVSIILARLLDPEVYGTVAIVIVFTTIAQVFIDSGFGTALIQKKDVDEMDYSTVFYFNVFACTVLYLILFFAAPLISNFYAKPELTPLVRVLGITLLISGLKNIQQAYVARNLLFKRFFFATLGGTIAAAIVGITMAYLNFGVWALVAQYIVNNLIDTIILWFTVKWRPQKRFSVSRFKILFSYGWKMMLSAFLNSVYQDLRQLFIGKVYSDKDLAFFNHGKKFPTLIVTNINTSIDSVLFPTMAVKQDQPQAVKAITKKSISVSTCVMAPLMIGMAVCAKQIVVLFLTEKWLPCVPFLQIYCISYIFFPIHTANLSAIKAMGKSGIFLKLEVIKTVLAIVILLISLRYGVLAIAIGSLIENFIGQLINSFPNWKSISYPYHRQIIDVLPQLVLASIMGVGVYLVSFLPLPNLPLLILMIITGGILYIGLGLLFRVKVFDDIMHILKNYFNK